MSMAYEEYMRQLVQPMRDELTTAGFQELRTPEDVDAYMEKAEGTTLIMINSVCGCAAGLARPAVRQAVEHDARPDNLVTVFAGQDKAATSVMRSYFIDVEPSSPSIALIKGKELVHFIPREEIEDHESTDIMQNLVNAFETHCK
ncbi:BrxA/BrxB family bacilliredoxin [Pseudalkalibacillus decolorationis]|uniref:BrxA/BrxB family bacilliredoxin n=1 Tax=Pseudalkalibacillus decolorationis TaxID=163879 RepID=UPI00214729F8|nr:BrxA/BrxB family bacilliredoxin [Pseudalkalibacillus decolorationis]